jgi:hypothetical protein
MGYESEKGRAVHTAKFRVLSRPYFCLSVPGVALLPKQTSSHKRSTSTQGSIENQPPESVHDI